MNALDEALEELQSYGTNYGPYLFANHAPMVAEALDDLGRSDAIAPWVERYSRHLEPVVPPVAPIGAETWRDALGDVNRFGDWTRFFRTEIESSSWQEVVRRWVPRLTPGYSGQLLHGAIRVAHAVRGLAAPSAIRLEELAGALAYWAVAYAEFDGSTRATTPLLSDLFEEGVRLYLANTDSPIGYAHAVTGPAAALLLDEWIEPDDRPALARHAAAAVDSIVARFGGAPAIAPDAAVAEGTLSSHEIVSVAIANGDEHVIKLVEACVRRWDNPLMRAAAEDVPKRL
jgi:hypothetical protein